MPKTFSNVRPYKATETYHCLSVACTIWLLSVTIACYGAFAIVLLNFHGHSFHKHLKKQNQWWTMDKLQLQNQHWRQSFNVNISGVVKVLQPFSLFYNHWSINNLKINNENINNASILTYTKCNKYGTIRVKTNWTLINDPFYCIAKVNENLQSCSNLSPFYKLYAYELLYFSDRVSLMCHCNNCWSIHYDSIDG